MNDWRLAKWGELATLEYGKAIREYHTQTDGFPVFGTNGRIGFHDEVLCPYPGVIVGRKGAYRGIHYSKTPFFVIFNLTLDEVAPYQKISFAPNWIVRGLLIWTLARPKPLLDEFVSGT
jgi:hypothetical protein